jgi:hypothetical protein
MTDAKAKRTIPALRSQLPVSFSRMDLPSFTSRYFDNASFLGGALIQNGGIACSSGFGVTGNNGAGTYLMTAAHCGEGTWTTGTVRAADGTLLTVTIGNTISAGRNTGRDVELILSPAGHGIYWGASINPPTSAGSNTYVNASGNTMNLPGAVICQSGAFSGTLCNAQIASVNNTITVTPPENGVERITSLVQAQSRDDTAIHRRRRQRRPCGRHW